MSLLLGQPQSSLHTASLIPIPAPSIEGLWHPRGAARLPFMSPVECLILEAKEALLDDQHRKFLQCYQEGRWEEANTRLQASMNCATDLLHYSLELLHGFEATESGSPHHRDDME